MGNKFIARVCQIYKCEIKCDAAGFKHALEIVRPVATKRMSATFYIFQNNALVKSIDKETIRVAAKNHEQVISCDIKAENTGDIAFVVNIRDAIKFLSKEKSAVTVSVGQTSVLLDCGESKLRLSTLQKPDDFALEKFEYNGDYVMPTDFIERIKVLVNYAATEECRPVLTGVSFITAIIP